MRETEERMRSGIIAHQMAGKKVEDYYGQDIPWRAMLKRSRMDVALICESHINGLAFLAKDQNLTVDFGFGLQKGGRHPDMLGWP
ncbi:hypothetical protein TWF696_002985 [Orbilia brochopaga]|uniref:Uncharacterized protein n=1 Tax=Orbilia brochopaga TaxID=3140254 RepID=A0AAV9U1C6_9PEZI